MQSLSKMFGVIISGVLVLAASGCVVTDLEDPAEAQYDEALWEEEAGDALDDAVEDEATSGETVQDEESGDDRYEALDDPEDVPWPDPFDPNNPAGNEVDG